MTPSTLKHLLLAALLLPCLASAQDTWTGADKKLHVSVSFVIGLAAGFQFPGNKPLAFGVALIPGVLKEISDRSTTGFSGKDIAANALGAALGVYASGWLLQHRDRTTTIAYATTF